MSATYEKFSEVREQLAHKHLTADEVRPAYFSKHNRRLLCTVHAARNLAKFDLMGKSDPYAVVFMPHEKIMKAVGATNVIQKSLDPVWNEEHSVFGISHVEKLQSIMDSSPLAGHPCVVELWDFDKTGGDDFMGWVALSQEDLGAKKQWFQLQGRKGGSKKEGQGEIQLSFECLDPPLKFQDDGTFLDLSGGSQDCCRRYQHLFEAKGFGFLDASDKVTKLKLPEGGDVFSGLAQKFPNLEELIISRPGTIDPSIGELKKLRKLEIQYNKAKLYPFDKCPALAELVIVSYGSDDVEAFPSNDHVHLLEIRSSHIKSLPLNFPNLTSLKVTSCPLLESIADFPKLEKLEVLRVEALTSLPDGLVQRAKERQLNLTMDLSCKLRDKYPQFRSAPKAIKESERPLGSAVEIEVKEKSVPLSYHECSQLRKLTIKFISEDDKTLGQGFYTEPSPPTWLGWCSQIEELHFDLYRCRSWKSMNEKFNSALGDLSGMTSLRTVRFFEGPVVGDKSFATCPVLEEIVHEVHSADYKTGSRSAMNGWDSCPGLVQCPSLRKISFINNAPFTSIIGGPEKQILKSLPVEEIRVVNKEDAWVDKIRFPMVEGLKKLAFDKTLVLNRENIKKEGREVTFLLAKQIHELEVDGKVTSDYKSVKQFDTVSFPSNLPWESINEVFPHLETLELGEDCGGSDVLQSICDYAAKYAAEHPDHFTIQRIIIMSKHFVPPADANYPFKVTVAQ